ncbi:alpha/beta fold hydrolase [Puniceicoccus vermicola]|uniref:Alpha/beta fold hydrolase n=1 Tax=Puniceicoccus vermicola TaxID=388746 RepID=A0A7X1E4D4_9BACT|nr:alpha/beta fold hydrolase [Puniceicoccus vermicola]MBC2602016.1 alpha/beta fold hydrolase [Puniceicoccus vermicola]
MNARRKKWFLWILALYLVLLGASHLKRAVFPTKPVLDREQKTFVAQGYGEDEGNSIRIAYLDEGPKDGIPVLLIHGSPVATDALLPLLDELPEDLRLIAPDLPGHGNSTYEVEDGSFRADADYLHQLIESLGIPSVQVVAYSRGGGPALQMIQQHPDEVSSLILVSSIGVQEQELLGNYTLNHALHSLQLGFFVLVEELVPHFGYLDNAILNSDYARSFSDADQRPLRKILSQVEVPTLIIHGKEDALVPVSAAREHHRIVPQSELVEMKGGHILIMRKAADVARRIDGFVHESAAGVARAKADASPTRLLQAAEKKASSPGAPASGRGLMFLAVILFFATFASEDLTCVIAGILAAAGTLSFTVATLACFLGILVGDLAIFFGGRFFGTQAVRYPPFRWVLTEERLDTAQEWFIRRGAVVILSSRFIPGSRLAVYFAAGMARTQVSKFLLYFLIAAIIWTPLLVGLAMLIGNPLLQIFARFEHWALPALIVLIAFILFVTKVIVPLLTARGRRISYGSWKRKVRWEFWPRWIFYPPVVLWVLWLGIRHRKPSLFTGANPGIAGGGIAFESKREIYSLLESGKGQIARTLSLPPQGSVQEWLPQIRSFQDQLPSPFPLVCKPDFGERGDGVSIVHNESDLIRALEEIDRDPIVQEFIPGLEYGIFFEKKPSESKGRVTSITRKIHTTVTGDGIKTLDELILADDRAVCCYSYFRDKHRAHLLSIPPKGEEYELATLGSHCRGSLFLDGSSLLTPELTEAVNQIFDGVEGLCFGRLDVKCPSDEDLQRGQHLTVLEFNGITSEPTHIYDPKHSLMYAYSVVFAQWARAFEIAAENRKAGHEPWSAGKTLHLMVNAMRGRPVKTKEKTQTPAS